ncbi:breast carcinoma-amplified sequence 1 isoform X2 [Tachyglossus aculeatus]|uniref:breast carcinoma-amplified sequence 1 isoform X2 n=1 Tax=Tachyglossus aculeatus TaxID=9261 RepID=UPI0018F3ED22|nr:breast carcinoma-amplified sequence 1 isoform X2 [Tachyglossus aculeatus]
MFTYLRSSNATMGNEASAEETFEDQENTSGPNNEKIASVTVCVQNGQPIIESSLSNRQLDKVDARTSVKRDNVAASSQKTIVISTVSDANGKDLGKQAKAPMPAAKSSLFFSLSRPVPGRTRDQGTDSSFGSVKLDVSSEKAQGNKAPSENMKLPATAALEERADKTQRQAPAKASFTAAQQLASPPPEAEQVAPIKTKETGFFDKFFTLDKGKDKALIETQEEIKSTDNHNPVRTTPGLLNPPNNVPEEKDLVASNKKDKLQKTVATNFSVLEDPKETEIKEENPKTENTTENNNPVMSFFKTLVSPNKAETKNESEDKSDEKPPASSAITTSDKANSPSRGAQGAHKAGKGSNPAAQQHPAGSSEQAKEKPGPTPTPLSKLFRKKSIKEVPAPQSPKENVTRDVAVQVSMSEEVDASLQTVDLNEEENRNNKATEVKPKGEENKTPRKNLMMFFKQLSVRDEGELTNSEESKSKDPESQTSDSTEKIASPVDSEPAGSGQKSKEGSKDKKAITEQNKQNKQKGNKHETKEQSSIVEQRVAEMNSVQNGGDSKGSPQKRPEKRQSFGSFFKGLGPKRMSDAEVQTDPVSILPAGKSK